MRPGLLSVRLTIPILSPLPRAPLHTDTHPVLYDHDWNPANDSQAQDRAYRIGQTKPVTVYKLISQGTIEEEILRRQAQKQSMADTIIGADEETEVGRLKAGKPRLANS